MLMSILFETKKTKIQKSHLKNLISLAKADGKISSAEMELIEKAAAKLGFKDTEIQSLIEDSKNTKITLPSNDSQRFDQLFELVQMMAVDGEISDEEMDFCILMAEKFGFRKAIVGILVRKISLGLTTGIDKDSIKAESEAFV
jgi:uncharacterized tellurite resistance protein B-like protein